MENPTDPAKSTDWTLDDFRNFWSSVQSVVVILAILGGGVVSYFTYLAPSLTVELEARQLTIPNDKRLYIFAKASFSNHGQWEAIVPIGDRTLTVTPTWQRAEGGWSAGEAIQARPMVSSSERVTWRNFAILPPGNIPVPFEFIVPVSSPGLYLVTLTYPIRLLTWKSRASSEDVNRISMESRSIYVVVR